MAAGRPILGLAHRGAALFDFLVDSGAGTCVEFGDDAGVEAALEQLLFTPNAGLAPHTERFRWSNLGLEYRAVLEAVSGTAAQRVPGPETRVPTPPRAAPDTSSRTAPAGRSASARSR